jgi:hypothetical protein
MKTKYLASFLLFAVLFTFPGLGTTAHADDQPILHQALDQLKLAKGTDDAVPSDQDRVTYLKSALKLLRSAPHNYVRHRLRAIDNVKAALAEIEVGDPHHWAEEDIRHAIDEVYEAIQSAP